ncbi:MAG: hypothetical protein MR902_01260, partial [Campylobacter sp.]|nr:hypothetical protein [Campylobacter sp.]
MQILAFNILGCVAFLLLNFYTLLSIKARYFELSLALWIVFFLLCALQIYHFLIPIKFGKFRFSSISLAFSFFAFLLCLMLDIISLFFSFDEFFLFGLIGICTFIIFGLKNALTPKLTTKTIKIKNLKEPINFAVISDIHLGKFLGAKFLDKIVDKINSLNYDALL